MAIYKSSFNKKPDREEKPKKEKPVKEKPIQEKKQIKLKPSLFVLFFSFLVMKIFCF